jgi:hypothetical protein
MVNDLHIKNQGHLFPLKSPLLLDTKPPQAHFLATDPAHQRPTDPHPSLH